MNKLTDSHGTQAIAYEKTIVKLGNGTDMNGASVTEALILRTDASEYGTLHYLLTPTGIALAGQYVNGGTVDYMYCTHLMPLSFKKWILLNWKIDYSPELVELGSQLKYLLKDCKSDAECELKCEEAIVALRK